ncbi:hypothetical protein, secreted, partial [gut metagenome]
MKHASKLLALLLCLVLPLNGCGRAQALTDPPRASAMPASQQTPRPYRAMWVSYLEWENFDFSSEDAFRAGAEELMQRCAELGLNTVIAQVRPFGDA